MWGGKEDVLRSPTQIKGVGKRGVIFRRRERTPISRNMSMGNKPCMSPSLGLIGVERQDLMIAAARMADMVGTACHRPARPGVEKVNGQRRMGTNGRMQAGEGCQAR